MLTSKQIQQSEQLTEDYGTGRDDYPNYLPPLIIYPRTDEEAAALDEEDD